MDRRGNHGVPLRGQPAFRGRAGRCPPDTLRPHWDVCRRGCREEEPARSRRGGRTFRSAELQFSVCRPSTISSPTHVPWVPRLSHKHFCAGAVRPLAGPPYPELSEGCSSTPIYIGVPGLGRSPDGAPLPTGPRPPHPELIEIGERKTTSFIRCGTAEDQ